MSLIVWLPLDGDLHNQGCTGYTITAIEASPTFTAGKIGQCYQRANTSSQITNGLQIQDNLVSTFGTAASVAVWVKPLGTHTHYNGTILSSGNWNAKRWAFGVSQDNSQVDVLCGGYNNYISCAVPVNQWTHLASTFENGVCKLYKNGVYVGEKSGQTTFDSDANWTGICRETYAGGYFGFNGCINDLRIYDHCLSAAEVREISQGLVLHYKLDDAVGFADLIARNVNVTVYNNHGNTNNPTTVTYLSQQYNGDRIIQYSATPNSSVIGSIQGTLHSHGIYNWSRTFKANTKYVFWIYYKPITHLDTIAGGTASNIGGWTEIPPVAVGDGWYRVGQYRDGTVTTDKTDSIFVSYKTPSAVAGDNIIIYFASPHLLEGTIEIPPYDYPSTIIQDSSGYSHNGTITGTSTLSSDTARYSSTLYFGAYQTPLITNNNPSFLTALTNCSVSWWEYITVTSNSLPFVGQSGSYYIGAGTTSTKLYHCNVGSSAKLYRNGVIEASQSFNSSNQALTSGTFTHTQNQWVHFVLSGANLSTWTAFKINGYGTGWPINGYISDVRIYNTALSAADILQLYHTGAKIGNKGDIHVYELNEGFGLEENAKFINNSATSMTYDAATDTYTIVSPVGTSSWGYGVRLADTPALEVPYGMTYRWTAEVWTPVALTVNTDYNNAATTAWAGNDNDATSTRLPAGNTIPANTWTRIYRGASNTHTSNTNHLPIRDYSSLGLVTNGQSGPVTWKVRHLQWYLVDTTFKPQIKKTGIIEAEHFTEVEQNLNKPAQFNKQMFSVNGNEFIEL